MIEIKLQPNPFQMNEWTLKPDYCHIVFFSGVPCLNFNHVIIMKDF